MDKAEWYTQGFNFGLKYRFASWLIRLFYRLGLISEEDVKAYSNTLINAWLIEQAEKANLKVKEVDLNE